MPFIKCNQAVETTVHVKSENRRGKTVERSIGVKLRADVIYGPVPEELAERLSALGVADAGQAESGAVALPMPQGVTLA